MGNKGPMVVVAGLILAGLAGLFLLRGGEEGGYIDRSVIGLHGLIPVYEADNLPVRASNRRLHPNREDLSFRLLPLYDIDLEKPPQRPTTKDELFHQQTQKDMERFAFETKLIELPTVLVLPKWRTGFVETGIAHDLTLIRSGNLSRLLRQIGLKDARINRAGPEFLRGTLFGADVALFQAQSLPRDTLPEHCRPEAALGESVFVLSCDLLEAEHATWIVTDPDLLNNHGLGLGDNARFATALARRVGGEITRDIYVDTSPDLLTEYEATDVERRDYERTADDFGRMFDYPFNVLWAMLALVIAVVYWRGTRRFGPVRPLDDPGDGHGISREASIAAKARLLRLSGHDGHLVSDFVQAQLVDITRQVFGPDQGAAGQERLFAHLARQDPTLAREFEATARALISEAPSLPQAEIYRLLGTYKLLLKQVVERYGSLRISTNH